MEINGGYHCTGNSRQTNIRYLFLKEGIDKSEVNIEYFSNHEMLACFFTIPLQGRFFISSETPSWDINISTLY